MNLDEEHEFSRGVRGSHDPLRVQPALEAPEPLPRLGRPLLLLGLELPLGGLCLALLPPPLEVVDEVGAVKVVGRLPGVVFVIVAAPFQQIFDLTKDYYLIKLTSVTKFTLPDLPTLLSSTFSTTKSSSAIFCGKFRDFYVLIDNI